MQESWLRNPRQGRSSEQSQSLAEGRERAAIKGTLLCMPVCLGGRSLKNSKRCLKIALRSEQGQLSEEAVAAGTEGNRAVEQPRDQECQIILHEAFGC